MDRFWEQLSAWWHAWTGPAFQFAIYNVTPRQGRHRIRRKLFRRLRQRIEYQPTRPAIARTP
jgi:hypothetical protein